MELEEEDSPHISIYPSLAPHIVNKKAIQSMSMQTVENEETSEQRTDSLIMDLSQTHVSQDNDQTVPDVTTADQTVPDVTTVEDAQHTMDDFPVEDLSALVGNMSLDEVVSVDNNTTQLAKMATTCCPHKEPELFQPPSTSTPCRDCSTLPPSASTPCRDCSTLPPSTSTPCHNCSTLPPSASTPCRNCSTLPPSTAPSTKPCEPSQFSNLNSNFVLQMTETTDDNSEDEQLDDYETSSDLDMILAVETPQHLWHSPEVKVVDNTFS